MRFTIVTSEKKVGRNTEVEVYVNMPGISEGSDEYIQNIWTLDKKEITPAVMNAIKYAFTLGLEAGKSRMKQRLNEYTPVGWEGPK